MWEFYFSISIRNCTSTFIMFACIYFVEDNSLTVVGQKSKRLQHLGQFKERENVKMTWGKYLFLGTIVKIHESEDYLTEFATKANAQIITKLKERPSEVPRELFTFDHIYKTDGKRQHKETSKIKESRQQEKDFSPKKKSNLVSMQPKDAPVVKLQAAARDVNPYRVKQGRENVILVCEVVDAYPPSISFVWTQNGNFIHGESRSNFIIPVATRQTNGTWGCKGFNGVGTPLESQLQVDVQYQPFIEPIGNKTVLEGQLFSVACNIDCNPLPVSVSWTKDNNSTFSHNTSVLKVDSINRYDRGTYRCTAVNQIHPSGENKESLNGMELFYLNVQYGAEIINISVIEGNTVNENTTATLRCLVDSNPKSNITWTKQGIMGVLQTNLYVHESLLIIEHAECLDTSNYTCNARNGVGQPVERKVTLFVTCHPRTDFRLPPVTSVYGKWYGNASLNYTVISFPEPIFNWTFIGNGSESRSLPDSATKHDSGLQSVLILTNLSINDFGFYRVIATNRLPTSSTEVFQLIPADVPDIPSNVTVADVKQTSLTVQWVAGYDDGLKQTFHIMITASDITRSVYAPDPGYGKLGIQTIEDLIPNTEYSISMSANNPLGSSSMSNVILQITLKEGTPANLGIPVAGIAGGVSAGFVLISVMGLSIFLWSSQQKHDVMEEDKERSVRHDAANGQEYEGLHLNRGEASPYLQLNDIRLEENRKANTRPPENDSYEKLYPYGNTDIQMYSSLKIPEISKDSEQMYENTQIM